MERKSKVRRILWPDRPAKFLNTQKTAMKGLFKILQEADDAEDLHDMRVAIRRTRALLGFVESDLKAPKFHRLSTMLKKCGCVLGAQRQLDVALKDAKHYGLKTSGLAGARKKAREEVARMLTNLRWTKLEGELGKFSESIVKINRSSTQKTASALLGRLKKIERFLPEKSSPDFHKFRIFVKKIRYTLEAVGRPLGKIKSLHSLLGKIHDLSVLQQLVPCTKEVEKDAVSLYNRAVCVVKPALRHASKELAAAAIESRF